MGNCYASPSLPVEVPTIQKKRPANPGGLFLEELTIEVTAGLIPNLPDDLALQCLAKIPLMLRGPSRLVCKAWREALHSTQLAELRRQEGLQEDFVFLCLEDPSGKGALTCKLYDWRLGKMCRLPPLLVDSLGYDYWCAWLGTFLVLGRTQIESGNRQQIWRYNTMQNSWQDLRPLENFRPLVACGMGQQVLMVGTARNQADLTVKILDLEEGEAKRLGPALPWVDSFDTLSCWADAKGGVHVVRGHARGAEFHVDTYEKSTDSWVTEERAMLPSTLTLPYTWSNRSQCPSGAIVNGTFFGLMGPVSQYEPRGAIRPSQPLEVVELIWSAGSGGSSSLPLVQKLNARGCLVGHSSIEDNWHESALGRLQKRVGQWGPFVNTLLAVPGGMLVLANFVTVVKVLADAGAFIIGQEELLVKELILKPGEEEGGPAWKGEGWCFRMPNLSELTPERLALVQL